MVVATLRPGTYHEVERNRNIILLVIIWQHRDLEATAHRRGADARWRIPTGVWILPGHSIYLGVRRWGWGWTGWWSTTTLTMKANSSSQGSCLLWTTKPSRPVVSLYLKFTTIGIIILSLYLNQHHRHILHLCEHALVPLYVQVLELNPRKRALKINKKKSQTYQDRWGSQWKQSPTQRWS